jgi:hypothetical protein
MWCIIGMQLRVTVLVMTRTRWFMLVVWQMIRVQCASNRCLSLAASWPIIHGDSHLVFCVATAALRHVWWNCSVEDFTNSPDNSSVPTASNRWGEIAEACELYILSHACKVFSVKFGFGSGSVFLWLSGYNSLIDS